MKFLQIGSVNCRACEVYREQVKYLKDQVDRLADERAEERAEYKRAIDALLIREKLPAIGQGFEEKAKPINPTTFFKIFEEEEKSEK